MAERHGAAQSPARAALGRGPASPTPSAAVAHRPLDGPGARLTGGLLHDWQRRNRRDSLPLAMRRMDTAGNLGNVRLAIAGATEGYRGPVFMDSDLYKTLEATGWELGRAASQTLAAFAADATALLEKAQEVDGYLNSYIQVSGEPRYRRLASSHEMYCAGHLIQAALALPAGLRLGRADAGRAAASPITWSRSSWAGWPGSTATRRSRPHWPSCTARPATGPI